MHYSTLSLERIVLTHLAASLWDPDDVREISREAWNGWTERARNAVIERVSRPLPPHLQALPTPLQDKITVILGPVGKQLVDWVRYHDRFHTEYFALQSLSDLKWSPLGIIDKRAIVECWVQDERLKIDQRYQLACVYCLEPHIRSLWQQMPPALKPYYFNAQTPKNVNQDPLVQFWTYRIEGTWNLLEASFKKKLFRKWKRWGRLIPDCTPEGCAFWQAVLTGNSVATHYFLSELSPEERQRHLIPGALSAAGIPLSNLCLDEDAFPRSYYTEVCVGLLRCMSEAAQLETFRRDIVKNGRACILRCLLEWPWLPYFLETAERIWEFMPQEVYASLISSIGFKLAQAPLYRPILEAYWAGSPSDYRQYLVNSWDGRLLLEKLFKYRDLKNIYRFLEELNPKQKEAIINSYNCRDVCFRLAQQQDWKTLEWFTGECLPSPSALLRFKTHLQHYVLKGDLPIWQPFLAILDRMASESPGTSLASEASNGMLEMPPETAPRQQSPLSPLKRPANAPENGSSPAKRRSLWSLPSSQIAENATQEAIPACPSL